MSKLVPLAACLLLIGAVSGLLACDRITSSARLPQLPTPLPLSEFQGTELVTDGWLTDMHGDRAVGITDDGEVMLINVRTGETRQLTDDGHQKWAVVLSSNHVAWIDQSRQFPVSKEEGRVEFTDDIFVMNLHTGEQLRITDTPANRSHLRISGSRLVWEDSRNELRDDWENYDIYAYDIRNGQEVPVAIAPGNQKEPAIHGDIVVWSDNRNSAEVGTRAAGCHNLADRRCDIYSYDFATGEEKLLVQTGRNNGSPSIHGDLVAWQGYLEEGQSLIVMLDLGTGERRDIGLGGRSHARPLVSDSYVVWTVSEACDVGGPSSFGGNETATGAFAYRLDTGEVLRLSNYVEPTTLLHDNVAVVTEACFGAFRRYAVVLD